MVYSDKMRHFPIADPPTVTAKEKLRQEIARHVENYMANGGEIATLGNPVNMEPVKKRTKRKQIEWLQKRVRFRRK